MLLLLDEFWRFIATVTVRRATRDALQVEWGRNVALLGESHTPATARSHGIRSCARRSRAELQDAKTGMTRVGALNQRRAAECSLVRIRAARSRFVLTWTRWTRCDAVIVGAPWRHVMMRIVGSSVW
jgi:hypothetical protein